ncbi:MAG: nicotinate-nucleotide adenylyltransferase [Beijerinckiaceae bacterium]
MEPAADHEPSSLGAPHHGGFARLPRHTPGMRIGLFGGTFNPPHMGHRLASVIALKRLKLDAVWWLVTPGNPLKENSGLPPLGLRMQAARKLADHPRIVVTGLEADIGTRFTYDTIEYLHRRCPGVRFVWIMGADNLRSFHRWQRWREITKLAPIAVIDRPQSTLKAAHSRAASYLAPWRLDEADGSLLAERGAPGFIFLHGPRSDLSSTELRARGLGLANANG